MPARCLTWSPADWLSRLTTSLTAGGLGVPTHVQVIPRHPGARKLTLLVMLDTRLRLTLRSW